MKKLLVTGISGFLGWHIAKHIQNAWTLLGVFQNTKPDLSEIPCYQLDLIDNERVIHFLKIYQPDGILHLAANSNPNDCEKNPAARQINIDATLNLAQYCADQKIPFLFTSTDLVFDGKNAPYHEDATPSPISIYGKQKAEAETEISKIHPQAIIARMPLMYGLPSNGKGFMQAWLNNLKAGKNIHCFTDEFRTSVSGADAASGVFLLLEKNQKGIFHLGGKESFSRYEFAVQMAETFNLSKNLILPSLQKEVNMAAARPPNVSFQSEKAYALGYAPNSLKVELKRLVVQAY